MVGQDVALPWQGCPQLLLWKSRSKRLFTTTYVTFLCHSGNAPRLQHLILNVFKAVLVISWGCYNTPTLLFFMKDCYVLLKEEWDYMNLRDLEQVGFELCSFLLEKKKTKQTPPKHKKTPRKWKIFFFIGEFWNVQTKQLVFQLLQVLNNSKQILCYDLSQRIILSWSQWTAGFIASLAVVILNFDIVTCTMARQNFKLTVLKNGVMKLQMFKCILGIHKLWELQWITIRNELGILKRPALKIFFLFKKC